MKELIKGANTPLAACGPVRIRLNWRTAPDKLDLVCLAINAQERVLTDDWFVFYNQPVSPANAIRFDPRRAEFLLTLDLLPVAARKCLIIAVLATTNSFRDLGDLTLTALPTNNEGAIFRLTEPAPTHSLLLAELYRYHDQWKIRAKGEGLNGDLAVLARSFGVNVIDDTPPPVISAQPAPTPANLPPTTRPVVTGQPPRLPPSSAAGSSIANQQPAPLPILITIDDPAQQPAALPVPVPQPAPEPAPVPPAAGHPLPAPYDRQERLKTYATLAIAFGSLTTAITTLVTQCVPHPPVVMVQPVAPPVVQQSNVSNVAPPGAKPPPISESPVATPARPSRRP
ncbi:MAG: TerD family protein [Candidatus Competibacteraceae bacterium]